VSDSFDGKQAAHRHHEAAKTLDQQAAPQRAAAAYLFGLAAECAVKAMLEASGLRPSDGSGRSDPYWAHFPELKRLLADRLEGRNAAQLARFTNDAFLSEWAIGIRYAPNAEVLEGQAREKRYERWKRDADTAIQAMQEVA